MGNKILTFLIPQSGMWWVVNSSIASIKNQLIFNENALPMSSKTRNPMNIPHPTLVQEYRVGLTSLRELYTGIISIIVHLKPT